MPALIAEASGSTCDLLPYDNILSFAPVCCVDQTGGDGQCGSVHLKETHLIGPVPGLVPGDVDMVGDLAGLQRVSAGIREHCLVEHTPFLVRQSDVAWRDASARCSDRLHPPIRRVA